MKSQRPPKDKFKKSEEELSFQEKLAAHRNPKPSTPNFYETSPDNVEPNKGRVKTGRAVMVKKSENKTSFKPQKSWDEEGIPSDRVAPGAPNPPPPMGDIAADPNREKKKKSKKMRHGAY